MHPLHWHCHVLVLVLVPEEQVLSQVKGLKSALASPPLWRLKIEDMSPLELSPKIFTVFYAKRPFKHGEKT